MHIPMLVAFSLPLLAKQIAYVNLYIQVPEGGFCLSPTFTEAFPGKKYGFPLSTHMYFSSK